MNGLTDAQMWIGLIVAVSVITLLGLMTVVQFVQAENARINILALVEKIQAITDEGQPNDPNTQR